MHTREEILGSFSRLLDVMDELREKCPWDKKQTFGSLRNNTVEEVFELSEAIAEGNLEQDKKELGDVLLHVVFYARMGSETGDFDIKDVCDALVTKLIFRHPHIYGNVEADTAEKVKQNWEELKLKEKDGNKRVLRLVGYRKKRRLSGSTGRRKSRSGTRSKKSSASLSRSCRQKIPHEWKTKWAICFLPSSTRHVCMA